MTSSAITLSPLALLIAVLAYVLKRWWDTADEISKSRKEVYRHYYEACYALCRELGKPSDTEVEAQTNQVFEQLQVATPEFYLYGSPLAISISDVFFGRCMEFARNRRSGAEADQLAKGLQDVHESLNVLREVLKSELFTFSPRFQFERLVHRKKWKSYTQEKR